jgi:hypothetical protein
VITFFALSLILIVLFIFVTSVFAYFFIRQLFYAQNLSENFSAEFEIDKNGHLEAVPPLERLRCLVLAAVVHAEEPAVLLPEEVIDLGRGVHLEMNL